MSQTMQERNKALALQAYNVSPVFRRDVQRAAQGHRLSSRRNSGQLDETDCGIPIPRCRIEFQLATREPTWGIVSRLN